MKTISELIAQNVKAVLDHGPRIRRYNTPVLARDPVNHCILLGGLGAMGVGQMWVDEEPGHKAYPGYNEAPIRSRKPGDL